MLELISSGLSNVGLSLIELFFFFLFFSFFLVPTGIWVDGCKQVIPCAVCDSQIRRQATLRPDLAAVS